MTAEKKRTFYAFFLAAVVALSGIVFIYLFSGVQGDSKSALSVAEKGFFGQFNYVETYSPTGEVPLLELYDLQDRKHSFNKIKGDLLLVNFWAAWCAPCVFEIPTLVDLQNRFEKHDLRVVFISLDYPDSADHLKVSMKKLKIPAIDTYYTKNTEVWDLFGITGLPATFLVSQSRGIMYKMVGDANWDSVEARQFMEAVIKS